MSGFERWSLRLLCYQSHLFPSESSVILDKYGWKLFCKICLRYGNCIVMFGLPQQNTMNWLAHTTEFHFSLCWGLESASEVPAGLVPAGASLFWLADTCLSVVFSLPVFCLNAEKRDILLISVSLSFYFWGHKPYQIRAQTWPHLILDTSLKALCLKSHIGIRT